MTLDFWFDYSCPYAYLGATQVEALASRAGARLTWKPMLLGGVFKAAGTPQNLSSTLSKSKARHNELDMLRWAALFDVALVVPAGHPLRTVDALRVTLACGIDPKVVHGFYRAYWVLGRTPADRATIDDVLRAAGHDPAEVIARSESNDIKADLRARTDEAIARGIFGAPSFIVNGTELFWGQDRLHFVERALQPQH